MRNLPFEELKSIIESLDPARKGPVLNKVEEKRTLLQHAVAKKDLAKIKLLVSHGAEFKDEDKLTVIQHLSAQEFAEFNPTRPSSTPSATLKDTINTLKEMKLDLHSFANRKNAVGGILLVYCSYYDRYDDVKLLLKNGADVTVKDGGGKTAYEWVKYKQGKITRLLFLHNQEEIRNFLKFLPENERVPYYEDLEFLAESEFSLEDISCCNNVGWGLKQLKNDTKSMKWYLSGEKFHTNNPSSNTNIKRNLTERYFSGVGTVRNWEEAYKRIDYASQDTLEYVADYTLDKKEEDLPRNHEIQLDVRKRLIAHYLKQNQEKLAYDVYLKIDKDQILTQLCECLKKNQLEQFEKLAASLNEQLSTDPLLKDILPSLIKGFLSSCDPEDRIQLMAFMHGAKDNTMANKVMEKCDRQDKIKLDTSIIDRSIEEKQLDKAVTFCKAWSYADSISVKTDALEKIANSESKEQSKSILEAQKVLILHYRDLAAQPYPSIKDEEYQQSCKMTYHYVCKYQYPLEKIARNGLFDILSTSDCENAEHLQRIKACFSDRTGSFVDDKNALILILGFIFSQAKEDRHKYIRLFEKLSVDGDYLAATVLCNYHKKCGIEKQENLVKFWMERAAILGSPYETYDLAGKNILRNELLQGVHYLEAAMGYAIGYKEIFDSAKTYLSDLAQGKYPVEIKKTGSVPADIQAQALVSLYQAHKEKDPKKASEYLRQLTESKTAAPEWKNYALSRLGEINTEKTLRMLEEGKAILGSVGFLYKAEIYLTCFIPKDYQSAFEALKNAYFYSSQGHCLRYKTIHQMELLANEKEISITLKRDIHKFLAYFYKNQAQTCINDATKLCYNDRAIELCQSVGIPNDLELSRTLVELHVQKAGIVGSQGLDTAIQEIKKIARANANSFEIAHVKLLELAFKKLQASFEDKVINFKQILVTFESYYNDSIKTNAISVLVNGLNLHVEKYELTQDKGWRNGSRELILSICSKLLTIDDKIWFSCSADFEKVITTLEKIKGEDFKKIIANLKMKLEVFKQAKTKKENAIEWTNKLQDYYLHLSRESNFSALIVLIKNFRNFHFGTSFFAQVTKKELDHSRRRMIWCAIAQIVNLKEGLPNDFRDEDSADALGYIKRIAELEPGANKSQYTPSAQMLQASLQDLMKMDLSGKDPYQLLIASLIRTKQELVENSEAIADQYAKAAAIRNMEGIDALLDLIKKKDMLPKGVSVEEKLVLVRHSVATPKIKAAIPSKKAVLEFKSSAVRDQLQHEKVVTIPTAPEMPFNVAEAEQPSLTQMAGTSFSDFPEKAPVSVDYPVLLDKSAVVPDLGPTNVIVVPGFSFIGSDSHIGLFPSIKPDNIIEMESTVQSSSPQQDVDANQPQKNQSQMVLAASPPKVKPAMKSDRTIVFS